MEIGEGCDVLLYLLDAAGADEGAGHAGIAQNPGQGHLCDRLVPGLGQFVEGAHLA